MRIILSIIAIGIVCTPTIILANADALQLRVNGGYYMPSGAVSTGGEESGLTKEVEWDKGTGFEVQAIFWPNGSTWGLGASIGKASWDIKDYEDSHYDYYYGAAFANVFSGDTDLTSIGLSVFRKLQTVNNKAKMSVEAGVRLISLDANIDGGYGIADYTYAIGVSQTLKLDDCVVGLIAFNLDYSVNNSISLFAQAGFQFDVSKGGVQNVVEGYESYDAGETELQAVFAKAGIAISL
jgi:hypothetical protein